MHGKKLLTLTRELLSLPTAPYHERHVSSYITDYCRSIGVRVESDSSGNLIARYQNRVTRPPLVFVAHMDHPGFELLNEMSAEFLGGVKQEMFVGSKIRFYTELGETKGANSRSSHRKYFSSARTTIDSLVRLQWPKRKVVQFRTPVKLSKGTLGMWELPPFDINKGKLSATAIDDVVGSAVLLATLTNVIRNRYKTHLWCVFTRAEEVGFHGAIRLAACQKIPTGAAIISIEMSSERPWAKIGQGPIVRVGDRMTTFDPKITLNLSKTAQQLTKRKPSFSYQRCLMDGGSCESSAFAAFGYTVGGLCLPLGNYHNMGKLNRPQPEYISVNDLQNLVHLTTTTARDWISFSQISKHLKSQMTGILKTAPRVLKGHNGRKQVV